MSVGPMSVGPMSNATASEDDESTTRGPGEVRELHPDPPLRWWKEVVAATVFYVVYSFIRNTQGSAAVSDAEALHNARRLIDLERIMGLYHERTIQEAFLDAEELMSIWNLFYGTFHFVVTIGVLVFLFRRFPTRYRRWRTCLAGTTALALIGFALYPLMPPRLMPTSYGFVDSLKTYGSLWSFDSGAMNKISNQYAAMPSLHFAWALWCTLVLVPALRRRWTKALAIAYPVLTLFAIVVTANHFVLDAVGGALVLGVGTAGGFALARRTERVRSRRREAEVDRADGGPEDATEATDGTVPATPAPTAPAVAEAG